MTQQVLVKNGTYRGVKIENTSFEMIKKPQKGAKGMFLTVHPAEHFPGRDKIRINIENENCVEFDKTAAVEKQSDDTDEQIMDRIEQRFQILEDMTRATINGDVRAMIVTGPPGVGKSYGVEVELEKASLFDQIAGKGLKYEVVKGAMTPIGLYATLYNHSDKNHVLVFDDCDSILLDDLSLNILKAALDSGKRRRIYWNADSAKLRNEGIPNSFDFKGGVIFITNLNFDNLKSKKLKDHLDALQSRCHFLDLTMNTMRDKILRIKQIFRKGDLFEAYDFSPEKGEEIIEFMAANCNKLREVSLRMALKIADLTKVSENWQSLAEATCMRNRV